MHYITLLAFTCSKSTTETLGKKCKICSNLTIKTLERRQWRRFGVFIVNFTPFSSVSIIGFEQGNISRSYSFAKRLIEILWKIWDVRRRKDCETSVFTRNSEHFLIFGRTFIYLKYQSSTAYHHKYVYSRHTKFVSSFCLPNTEIIQIKAQ